MAGDAFRVKRGTLTTGSGTVLACPPGKVLLVRGLRVCNRSLPASAATYTLEFTGTVSYLARNTPLPPGAIDNLVDGGEMVMRADDGNLMGQASAANAIDYHASYLERDA